MFITYLKPLKSLTSITERILRVTRFPLHFICSSWMPQRRKLPTCQSQRGGRYRYHPKSQCRPQGWCQLSHEKTSAQCLKCRRTMSQHHTYSSQEGDITPTAPLFVKTWAFPQNALMHFRYPFFLCWKFSSLHQEIIQDWWCTCSCPLYNCVFKLGCDKMWAM